MSIDLTFIGQIVVFLALVFLMKKYLYGPLNDLLEARARRIAEGLASADAGKEARTVAEAEIKELFKESRVRAQEIVSTAEKRAAEIHEEAVNKARADAQKIVDAAREEVGAEVEKARLGLRKEVAGLAVLAAERVLDVELDARRHAKLIDGVISQGIGSA